MRIFYLCVAFTFLTMAYILAVHPSLLSQMGMDANALFTTTILSAAIATLLMALYAKLPFALAPSMGVNAFFVYTIVMVMGYSWSFALTGHASGIEIVWNTISVGENHYICPSYY